MSEAPPNECQCMLSRLIKLCHGLYIDPLMLPRDDDEEPSENVLRMIAEHNESEGTAWMVAPASRWLDG